MCRDHDTVVRSFRQAWLENTLQFIINNCHEHRAYLTVSNQIVTFRLLCKYTYTVLYMLHAVYTVATARKPMHLSKTLSRFCTCSSSVIFSIPWQRLANTFRWKTTSWPALKRSALELLKSAGQENRTALRKVWESPSAITPKQQRDLLPYP